MSKKISKPNVLAPDYYKCADKILIIAVLQWWLINQRETEESFVLIMFYL